MRYWWVNQNQTYTHEVPGGYLWSPAKGAGGKYNYFYETMTRVEPGDVVFSFARSHIMAVGLAVGRAEPSIKPDFGTAGANWSDAGWLVQVEFHQLERPIRPKDHMERLAGLLPEKYSPISRVGNGYQHVYLAELPLAFALAMQQIIGAQISAIEESRPTALTAPSVIEADLERLIGTADINQTEKIQIINARRGQGLFRNNVRLTERQCRVTGVQQMHHLRASHIKPWRDSTNHERLLGSNGLLLAPHVDHLFDRGFISFEDNGDMIVSPHLEGEVLDAWSVAASRNVGSFNTDQRYFLDFHRRHVLVQEHQKPPAAATTAHTD